MQTIQTKELTRVLATTVYYIFPLLGIHAVIALVTLSPVHFIISLLG